MRGKVNILDFILALFEMMRLICPERISLFV